MCLNGKSYEEQTNYYFKDLHSRSRSRIFQFRRAGNGAGFSNSQKFLG